MTTRQKVGQGVAVSSLLVGWCTFLWQMSELLHNHTDWDYIDTPVGVSEILRAVLYASLAIGGAMFSDFRKLFAMVRGSIK